MEMDLNDDDNAVSWYNTDFILIFAGRSARLFSCMMMLNVFSRMPIFINGKFEFREKSKF